MALPVVSTGGLANAAVGIVPPTEFGGTVNCGSSCPTAVFYFVPVHSPGFDDSWLPHPGDADAGLVAMFRHVTGVAAGEAGGPEDQRTEIDFGETLTEGDVA